MKNILKENMRRFGTKNLNEQNYPDFMLISDDPNQNIVAVISKFRFFQSDKRINNYIPGINYQFIKFEVVDRVQGFDRVRKNTPGTEYYLHKKDGTPFFRDTYDKQFQIFQEHELDPKAGQAFQDHGYIRIGSAYGLTGKQQRELLDNPNELIWLSKTPKHPK